MTNVGRDLIAKLAATQRQLVFSSVKVGDGQITTQAIADMTALISLRKSLNISRTPQRTQVGRWDVSAVFNNADVAVAFWLREWGVFAIDPDTATEVMVLYANAGASADYIPAWNGEDPSTFIEEELTCNCIVSSELQVTAEIDASRLFVTEEQLEEHNTSPDAHADIRTLVDDTYTKAESNQQISSAVSTHNANAAAHPAIQTQITNASATLQQGIDAAASAAAAAAATANAAMPKAGGAFTGPATAGGSQAAATAQMRNIILTNVDPGTGSTALPEGTIVLVYE